MRTLAIILKWIGGIFSKILPMILKDAKEPREVRIEGGDPELINDVSDSITNEVTKPRKKEP